MTRSRSIGLFATLALVVASAFSAWAVETGPRARPHSTVEAASGTVVSNPDSLESLLGREVKTRVEGDGGRIIDLLVDRQGRVQAALIEFGGFLGIGTRKIAVAWSALRFQSEGKKQVVVVDLTRDQLRAMPEYKPGETEVVRETYD